MHKDTGQTIISHGVPCQLLLDSVHSACSIMCTSQCSVTASFCRALLLLSEVQIVVLVEIQEYSLDPYVLTLVACQLQAYGEIRSLYTACKPRGFVVLSFYDLRAACLAIAALQGASVGSGNLHISFSTPNDNMGDKDAHQGAITSLYNDCIGNQEKCPYTELSLLRSTTVVRKQLGCQLHCPYIENVLVSTVLV